MSDPTPIHRPFYEGLIARHFPGWYAQRERSRLEARQFGIVASYRGGVATRTSNGWSQSTSYATGTQATRTALFGMRDRGRKVFANNLVGRTLVNTETDNVVADGFTLQAKTDVEDFNRRVEAGFAEWMEAADIRGIRSGAQLQRTVWITRRVDGDCGVLLVDQGTGGESRLQVIPGDRIKNPDGKFGPNMVDGVEVDAAARPVAYHIADESEWGKRKFVRVPARDFIYLPNLNDADPLQLRGETCYAQIFDQLDNLDQYVDGVALAAWMATVFGIVFKEQAGAKQHGNLPGITNSAGVQQKALRLENGSVRWQGREDEMVQVDAKQPMTQTPEFIRAMLRLIGMPFDMPLELIAKDMSQVNFASARIGLLGFYRSCRVKQCWFTKRFLSRVYQWWISREVKTGRLEVPASIADSYWRHSFVPRGWDYTDPVSEAQGDLLEISMGTKTPQMVAAERGRDYMDMQADIAAARAARAAAELPWPLSTFAREEVPPAPEPVAAEPTDEPEPNDE